MTLDQPRLEAAAQAEKDGAADFAEAETVHVVYRLGYAQLDPPVPLYLTVERVFDLGPDRNPRFVVQDLERDAALLGETTADICARAARLVREWAALVATKAPPPRDVRLEIPDDD